MQKIQDFPLLLVKFRDLRPHHRNAEIYAQRSFDPEMAHSVTEFGVLHDPLAHRREDGSMVILSGHRRIEGMLAAGKTLDDTILCRVLSGLTEYDERAILIHANKTRKKTKREEFAERHEIIAIGTILGLAHVSMTKEFMPETPRNLEEAAKLIGRHIHTIRNVSAIMGHVQRLPEGETKKQAQAAFDAGLYRTAWRFVKVYWSDNPRSIDALKHKLRSSFHKQSMPGFRRMQRMYKAQKLELEMLKEKLRKQQAEDDQSKTDSL